MKNFIAYLKDESGQTSTEYILLVAVVAAVVFKFREVIMGKLVEGDDSLVNKVFNKADDLLETN